MQSIYSRIKERSVLAADKAAVIVDGQIKTYAELIADVELCAGSISARGVSSTDCIAVVLPNGYRFVVSVLAVMALGARLVPLNPAFRPEELERYFQDCNVAAIFYQQGLQGVEQYLQHSRAVGFVESDVLDSNFSTFSDEHSSGESALHMFSSGSTGKSKRITRTQKNIVDEFDMLAATLKLSSNEIVLCTVPMFHAHGFGNALIAAILSGSTLVILTTEFNARKTIQALEDYSVTLYPSVPFMLKIISVTRFDELPVIDSLRYVLSAGAALAEATAEAFYQQYGVGISQLYGSTETGAVAVNASVQPENWGSVGEPLQGVNLEIRDEAGNKLGVGEVGEVWIKSPAMTMQYDGLPEETQECFCADWFFAGDLGVITEQQDLVIIGRKKLLINVAGNKVDPKEVESVLVNHQDVEDVVVVGKDHAVYGEKVRAYIVTKSVDTVVVENKLREFATTKLVEYKVPNEFEFVEAIPRSPMGKVLRKYL